MADADLALPSFAKLTTRLHVVGVRADGMHLIDAEMVSLSLCDELRLTSSPSISVTYIDARSGKQLDVGPQDLVTKALTQVGQTARVEVFKNIPPGAGLGGGSSNAAAVLRHFGYTDVEGAAQLGADVAFCLIGGRAHVRGIGEIVADLEFEEATFTLLTPPIHCSTPAVYRRWDQLDAEQRSGHHNDLEPAAMELYPELASFRDQLRAASGQEPMLAGSGSTWFVRGSHSTDGTVVAQTVRRQLGADAP